MRTILGVLGACVIVVYAVLGAVLMNRWELEAATGLPIETTVAEMALANQQYGVGGGIVFGVMGVLLALGWLVITLVRKIGLPGWFSLAVWGAIVALGAPAYFFASFSNMNSVGDTFYDWDSEAAFALVSPLYVLSGVAAVVAVVAFVLALVRRPAARGRD